MSGLRHYRTEYLVIVDDRAYQRERNTETHDWSKWVEFDTGSVDPTYTGGLLELTFGLDEYLSSIPWSSITSSTGGGIWLRGTRSEGDGFFTHYRMLVHKAGPSLSSY